VNLATGVITSGTGTIQSVGNGWYRVSITQTFGPANANGGMIIDLQTTAGYTGDGYSGVFLWGAQLEAGAFPTSYIKTEASQVTRSRDAASMTGTNFSSWYRQDEGTLYVDWVAGPIVSGFPRTVELNDATAATNFIRMQRYSAGQVRFSITSAGVSQAGFDSSTVALGATAKAALAYKFNDIAGTANAATVGTDTSATMPVVTQMNIGDSFATGSFVNSTIRKIAYYPKRLSNAELQNLTKS
jgi:hypothetical protein